MAFTIQLVGIRLGCTLLKLHGIILDSLKLEQLSKSTETTFSSTKTLYYYYIDYIIYISRLYFKFVSYKR